MIDSLRYMIVTCKEQMWDMDRGSEAYAKLEAGSKHKKLSETVDQKKAWTDSEPTGLGLCECAFAERVKILKN